MARGYSMHIGLGYADENVHGDPMIAFGCDTAAGLMREIALELGYAEPGVPIVNSDATIEKVRAEFDRIKNRLEDDDIFLMTFAGHGEERDDGDCEEKKNQALVLFNHKWIDDQIYDVLASIPVRARVIVVVDACMSGTALTALAGLIARLEGVRSEQTEPPPDDEPLITARDFNVLDPEAMFACRPKLTANVLLLAAAEDTLTTTTLRTGGPVFTTALVDSWRASTSYRDLKRRIQGLLPSRTPQLNDRLVTDINFLDERPFSI